MYSALPTKSFLRFSEKVEKSVEERQRETEVHQRKILMMIENLSSKSGSLTGINTSEIFELEGDFRVENAASLSRVEEPDGMTQSTSHYRLVCLDFNLNYP